MFDTADFSVKKNNLDATKNVSVFSWTEFLYL